MKPEFNTDIKVLTTADESRLFRKIDADTSEITELAQKLATETDNRYIASDVELEALPVVKEFCRKVFAELPVQAGWCFGRGRKMNGVEWHKSSEVVVACTDMALILGDWHDIRQDIYDSSDSVALLLKKGEAAELFAGTLHLAPLPVDDTFAAAIILPAGTNAPLAGGIDGSMRAVNKWLLVHPENEKGIAAGGKVGVRGVNIAVR